MDIDTLAKPTVVVGLGELLWDLLPSGKHLGGAPANFAYMANLLGDGGVVASRVGNDELGRDAAQVVERLGVSTSYLQYDSDHPTGTVHVRVDSAGQPEFTITEHVAWDYLEWTPQWRELAHDADVICFGSLAQRSRTSRTTIRTFLDMAGKEALRIYDVNLRQSFYSREVLEKSLRRAHIVKFNDQELPRIAEMLGIKRGAEEVQAQRLLDAYGLRLVCVTRGARGSLLVSEKEVSVHPGFSVKVADAVGAGDSFTACLAHHYRRGAPLEEINETANSLAAWVSSQPGATPSLNGQDLQAILARVRESARRERER